MEERTMWLTSTTTENEKLRVKKERKKEEQNDNRSETRNEKIRMRAEWNETCIIDFNDDVAPSQLIATESEPTTHAIKTTYRRPFPEIVAAASLMISFSDDADEELEEENLTMQSTKLFQIW